MRINAPCIITPRLLPGLHIGNAFVSIEYNGFDHENRTKYLCCIDIGTVDDSKEYIVDDIRSGCGSSPQQRSLQHGLGSLLSFLAAASESYRHAMRTGTPIEDTENGELFENAVVDWAYQHEDEIACVSYELDEKDGQLIIEEE